MSKEELTNYITDTYFLPDVLACKKLTDKRTKEMFSDKELKNIHKISNHKQTDSMVEAFQNSGIALKQGDRAKIERMINKCQVCKRFKRSLAKPKVAWPRLHDFNQVVTLDLKEIKDEKGRKVYILWMICGFTRFARGAVLRKKDAKTTFEALMNFWNWVFGFPSKGFWSDNGKEFCN